MATTRIAAGKIAAAASTAHPAPGAVFNIEDWLVVALFVAAMIAVVLFAMRNKAQSGKDYFLSSRDSNWLQIGTSIFSSNIGSEHLVGLAGAGFATGMAMAHWEMQGWIILILGWVFVPLYDRMKVFTMPEFLELRFSRGSRNVLSFLTIASLVLTKIAVTIYAGDVVVRTLLGINTVDIFGFHIDVFWAIALGLAFTTGVYTVLGGLRVIMYTAVLQTPVLILGSLCILYAGLNALGHGDLLAGWHAMVVAAGANIHLIRPIGDPEWSWAAVLPGSAIIGFWYWCTDQYIVQRVLAGQNQQQSRRGAILAAFLKLTPVFIFLVPGMIAFALTKQPSSGFTTSGDAAYTSLVAQILPHGLRGMVACSMIVALMASLASKFNASATLFTMDFFREWYPKASGRTEVLVGRIATAVIVVMGICWVLVIKSLHSDLYVYLQSVQGYLSPAIAVLFLLGVFWTRATATAAFWSFIVGVAAGFARLAADLVMRNDGAAVAALKQKLYHGTINADQYAAAIAPIRAAHGWIFDFWDINWLYYTQILLVVTAVLMIAISLMTPAPEAGTVKFTWYGANAAEKAATRASWNSKDVVLSLVVVAPFPPKRIASPMLLGGPHAENFLIRAAPLGFSAKVFSREIGKASASKMCRSVMIKGIEALLMESMLTARHYGVEKTVLDSLSDLLPVGDWEKLARYMISRSLGHGMRRAEEMREVAATVREAGIAPLMSVAATERQDWAANHKSALAREQFGALLDDILKKISEKRA